MCFLLDILTLTFDSRLLYRRFQKKPFGSWFGYSAEGVSGQRDVVARLRVTECGMIRWLFRDSVERELLFPDYDYTGFGLVRQP